MDLEEDANLEEMMGKINAAVEDMRFPFGYELDQGSRYWEQQEQSSEQSYALLLSVVFVFLIMGVLFESIAVPLSIITTVPMALMVRVLAALFYRDRLRCDGRNRPSGAGWGDRQQWHRLGGPSDFNSV